ncbi:MAG: cardiolipin synthase [Phycisphaerales bacterium]|jgi:cardiolipin synthase
MDDFPLALLVTLAQAEGGDSLSAWLPLAYLLLEWVIRLVLAPIIIRKHSAGEALAWLALALFQPIPGAVLYAAFGRQLLGRRRVKANQRAARLVETVDRINALEAHAAPRDAIDPGYRDLFRLATMVGGYRPLLGNNGRIIDSGYFIDHLVEAIDAAENHVHLLTYIFRDDTNGRKIGDALVRAAERGVVCRVLADGSGSADFFQTLGRELREKGVLVRDALPSRFFRRTLARIDVRNHRKLTIIDGRIAYTGSQNICDLDYGNRRYGPWIDLTARITGPLAMQMQLLFLEDWVAETGAMPGPEGDLFPEPEHTGKIIAQAIPSGPGRREEAFRDVILSAINEANERIVMVTPYLIPDPPTQLALRLRALAGVKVDVIIPEKTNSFLVNAAAKSVLEELLDAGASVHLHQQGLLHVKALTVDDSLSVFGSGNFDRRSFRLNYELNLLAHGEDVTTALRSRLLQYLEDCRPLGKEELADRPWLQKLADDTAKIVSPLL